MVFYLLFISVFINIILLKYLKILCDYILQIWKLGLSTCYNFLVTMSVYPAVTVLITSVSKEHTAWTGINNL